MYLSAQQVASWASAPVSVSSDIPVFSGEWRLSLNSISLGEVLSEAIVKVVLNYIRETLKIPESERLRLDSSSGEAENFSPKK